MRKLKSQVAKVSTVRILTAIANRRFKNERFIYHASLTLQWTPLLLVVSMFACENTHRVALGLVLSNL